MVMVVVVEEVGLHYFMLTGEPAGPLVWERPEHSELSVAPCYLLSISP